MLGSRSKVLVDWDGVVLKSHIASRYITKKCELYVGHVTGLQQPWHMQTLNTALYKSNGHTVLGLRNMGYNISVRDFNKKVYGNIRYGSLEIADHEIDSRGLKRLMDNHEVYIYSNAPSEWIIETLSKDKWMGKKLLDQLRIIRPTNEEILKPDEQSFKDAALACCANECSPLYFVDDSYFNIQAASKVPGFVNLWMSQDCFQLHDHFASVRNLDIAAQYIDIGFWSCK